MSKYIVIYHAPAEAFAGVGNMSPEDMQKGMEPWRARMANVEGQLVDGGSPLMGGQRITTSGTSTSTNEVSGYSILEADNMDAAKALLNGHPHLAWAEGCAIEIHEAMPMM